MLLLRERIALTSTLSNNNSKRIERENFRTQIPLRKNSAPVETQRRRWNKKRVEGAKWEKKWQSFFLSINPLAQSLSVPPAVATVAAVANENNSNNDSDSVRHSSESGSNTPEQYGLYLTLTNCTAMFSSTTWIYFFSYEGLTIIIIIRILSEFHFELFERDLAFQLREALFSRMSLALPPSSTVVACLIYVIRHFTLFSFLDFALTAAAGPVLSCGSVAIVGEGRSVHATNVTRSPLGRHLFANSVLRKVSSISRHFFNITAVFYSSWNLSPNVVLSSAINDLYRPPREPLPQLFNASDASSQGRTRLAIAAVAQFWMFDANSFI